MLHICDVPFHFFVFVYLLTVKHHHHHFPITGSVRPLMDITTETLSIVPGVSKIISLLADF
jgi:hypothetical protein